MTDFLTYVKEETNIPKATRYECPEGPRYMDELFEMIKELPSFRLAAILEL